MSRGKTTCKVLKEVRRKIADANGIPLQERECTHTGDCAGTCPYCESEVRYLERELSKRKSLGKAVAVAGIAVAAVVPAMAQTPETNNPANGFPQTADQNDPDHPERPKTCDTYRLAGIVRPIDSSSTSSADTVVIEWEAPEYHRGDVVVWPVQDSVWRFPSSYGTLKSYLHKQLKNDPELRKWFRKMVAELSRDTSRDDLVVKINKSGEVYGLEVYGLNTNFNIYGEENRREYEKLFQIFLRMPAWELYPGKEPPDHNVEQRILMKDLW